MKKSVMFLMAVACWLVCTLPARADVIWEPQDDFYAQHQRDCEHVNRTFTANGPDGEVIVYKSPENPTVVDTWENGYSARISFVYTDKDGIEWGIYEDYKTDEGGWVPMAYMTVVYDYICFQEDYGEQIVEESGKIPTMYAGQTIYYWSYPGSENCFEGVLPEDEEGLPEYSKTYVDESGNQWGYIGYFRGIKNVWVCLSKATSDLYGIYPNGAPDVDKRKESENAIESVESIVPGGNGESGDEESDDEEVWESDDEDFGDAENADGSDEADRIEPERDNSLTGLVIGLVVAVTGATGGALAWLKKRK